MVSKCTGRIASWLKYNFYRPADRASLWKPVCMSFVLPVADKARTQLERFAGSSLGSGLYTC
jgi:hypothetical protein